MRLLLYLSLAPLEWPNIHPFIHPSTQPPSHLSTYPSIHPTPSSSHGTSPQSLDTPKSTGVWGVHNSVTRATVSVICFCHFGTGRIAFNLLQRESGVLAAHPSRVLAPWRMGHFHACFLARQPLSSRRMPPALASLVCPVPFAITPPQFTAPPPPAQACIIPGRCRTISPHRHHFLFLGHQELALMAGGQRASPP